MNNSKNVLRYIYGEGAINSLNGLVNERKNQKDDYAIYLVDDFFKDKSVLEEVFDSQNDIKLFIPTEHEPTTDYVDNMATEIKGYNEKLPCVLVGIGGGITLDVTKAVANLLTNPGKSEDYQGWDLVKNSAVYKIGVPTLSGTGAEASRTCVLTNTSRGLKLGMNSEFSIFDQLVLDPTLTKTVPHDQYFYTGMDTYIHCIESLNGTFRHALADAHSRQALELCKEVFQSNNMQSDSNRAKLMTASYFGGVAIANSLVGIVHPFSAGLSIVLGLHHCFANCIVMNVMGEFYPAEAEEFKKMLEINNIKLPTGICNSLSEDEFELLYSSTVIHERPLANALGDFRRVLTRKKVREIFQKM